MNTYRVNSSILPRLAEAKGESCTGAWMFLGSRQSFAEHGIAVADTGPNRPIG